MKRQGLKQEELLLSLLGRISLWLETVIVLPYNLKVGKVEAFKNFSMWPKAPEWKMVESVILAVNDRIRSTEKFRLLGKGSSLK
jgi:hypothetical protein